jgi:hypothetical protein
MLLIVEPVGQRQERSEEEGRELYQRMVQWGEGLKARGLLAASESLQSTSEGVRVQVRNGKATTVDGPFAETREMVGGFFLLTCNSKAQAVAIARECPAAEWATVEVRGFGPCYE